jgi:hypothetical protein
MVFVSKSRFAARGEQREFRPSSGAGDFGIERNPGAMICFPGGAASRCDRRGVPHRSDERGPASGDDSARAVG